MDVVSNGSIQNSQSRDVDGLRIMVVMTWKTYKNQEYFFENFCNIKFIGLKSAFSFSEWTQRLQNLIQFNRKSSIATECPMFVIDSLWSTGIMP